MTAVVRRAALSLARGTLAWCERGILSLPEPGAGHACPPVFIIGPPRSGTTLLYQVLVGRFTFGYFSNWMARFPASPIVAAWLHRMQTSSNGDLADYASEWGQTRGRTGPNEMGSFWYRWFPSGDQVYVPAGATPETALAELRREVSGMSRVFGASMLFKNTYNSMRVAPLVEAFPGACFVVCLRDPVENARSILKGRVRANGDKERWWALPPRELDEIRRHPYWEQVVEQVYYIQQQIFRDEKTMGSHRFHHVRYEEFCGAVHGTLGGIHRFFEQRGVNIRIRGEVPPRFPVSSRPAEDADDDARIVEKARQLWG